MREQRADDARGIFVFATTGDLIVFASIADASAYMEPPEVEGGEYVALHTLDAHVVTAAVASDSVVLTVTADRDDEGLNRRLDEYRQLTPLDLPAGRVGLANALLRWEWEHRWPKRPRWLSRRRFGEGPVQI